MRANIDALWPAIESGAEAIISTASGCGVHLKDYAYQFREDEKYFQKAQTISSLTRDISEYIRGCNPDKLRGSKTKQRIAFQRRDLWRYQSGTTRQQRCQCLCFNHARLR